MPPGPVVAVNDGNQSALILCNYLKLKDYIFLARIVYQLTEREDHMNVIDRHFGISPQALEVRAQRFQLISANLANADTPGYKARDIDFAQALSQARAGDRGNTRTHPAHIEMSNASYDLKYRVPVQSSLDGNSVETEQEHSAFMDNAIRYQASLNFLDGRIKSILRALRGE